MAGSFLRKPDLCSIDAAAIGIHRDRWDAISHAQASNAFACESMSKMRYDVLPIDDGGRVAEFFATGTWNDYSTVARRTIISDDVISASTLIEVLIHLMAERDRLFFFLAMNPPDGKKHSDSEEVCGLVSAVNLNSHPSKVYLFGLISQFEILIGDAIRDRVSDDELIGLLGDPAKDTRVEEVLRNYDRDICSGLDASLVEYLYLAQALDIAKKLKIHIEAGYTETEFEEAFASLPKRRNKVCHPSRSVITHRDSILELSKMIHRIHDGIDRFEKLLNG